uniref:transcriptional regulator FilR1 domain-containing protein n=1 Tax=Methanosarcina baikalica TaxID=3073890 RepID=UPI0037C84C81
MQSKRLRNVIKSILKKNTNQIIKGGQNKVSLYIYSGKIRPSSFMVADTFMMLKLFGTTGNLTTGR